MTLEVPRGDGIVPITITESTRAIRFSLGASDKGEAKQRQAAAVAYLEGLYANMRANVPVSLTHKQCVALSGELYRAWAAGLDGSTTISFEADERSGRIERVKEHLLEAVNPRTRKRLSMKTIGGSYFGGINVVFKWAEENGKLTFATNSIGRSRRKVSMT